MVERANELNMQNYYAWYFVTTVKRVRRDVSTSQFVLYKTKPNSKQ